MIETNSSRFGSPGHWLLIESQLKRVMSNLFFHQKFLLVQVICQILCKSFLTQGDCCALEEKDVNRKKKHLVGLAHIVTNNKEVGDFEE